MAVGGIDPRKFDTVWLDRGDYEQLFHRPKQTSAQPTSAPSTTAPSTSAPSTSKPLSYAQVAAKPAPTKPKPVVEKGLCSEGKDLLADIEAARGFIRASLQTPSPASTTGTSVESLSERATRLEADNFNLKKLACELTLKLDKLEAKVANFKGVVPVAAPVAVAAKPAATPAAMQEDSDDDFAFSDDDEDEAPKESSMEKMKRLAAEKKAAADAAAAAKGHTGPITKSNCIFDVKPWDDETDMGELEAEVRKIKMEGLIWGQSQLVDIGYGIKKLRICTVLIDHLVGLYDLEDNITALEDWIQSVDIYSHTKI